MSHRIQVNSHAAMDANVPPQLFPTLGQNYAEMLEHLMNRISVFESKVLADNSEEIIHKFTNHVIPWLDVVCHMNTALVAAAARDADRQIQSLNGEDKLRQVLDLVKTLLLKTCQYRLKGEVYRVMSTVLTKLLQLFGSALADELLSLAANSINKTITVVVSDEMAFKCASRNVVEDALCLEHAIDLLSHLADGLQSDGNAAREWRMVILSLLDVIDTVDESLVIRILLEIIPKSKRYLSDREVLVTVWNVVQRVPKTNTNNVDEDLRTWIILGCLSDLLFSDCCLDSPLRSTPIWMNNWFWKLIQRGLVQDKELQRRRSLYFLKRGLDWLESNRNAVETESDHGEDELFSWNSQTADQMSKYFTDIILILETVEEKQSHVMKPLCPNVLKLVEGAQVDNGLSCTLHTSWVGVIMHRLLRHDSRTIRKWTLETICHLDFLKFPLFKQGAEEILLSGSIEVLNDTALFSTRSFSNDESFIGNKLIVLWNSCYLASSSSTTNGPCFRLILKIIKSISWGTVPIMHLFRSLSHVPQFRQWNFEDIASLRHVLEYTTRTHDLFLRSATQCFIVEAFLKLANPEELSFNDSSTFLGILKMEECLRRGTRVWNLTVNWLRDILFKEPTSKINKELAMNFLTENLKSLFKVEMGSTNYEYDSFDTHRSLQIVRILIFLFDCGLLNASNYDQDDCLSRILVTPLLTLRTCLSRPYIVPGTVERCIQFMLQMISQAESVDSGIRAKDELNEWLTEVIGISLPELLPFIKIKLIETGSECPSAMDCYFNLLEYAINHHGTNDFVQVFMLDLCQSQMEALNNNESPSRIKQFIAGKCLEHFYTLLSLMPCPRIEFKSLAEEFAKVCLKGDFLITVAPNINVLSFADMKHKINSNQLSSLYLSTLWTCMALHLQLFPATNDVLMNHSQAALDIGGAPCARPIFKCLEHILPRAVVHSQDLVAAAIESCWNVIDHMKLNVDYWGALESFVEMAYQAPLLENRQTALVLQKCALNISEMSEYTHRIIIQLFNKTSQIWMGADDPTSVMENLELLILFLTFGFAHYKDVKVLHETVSFVVNLEKDCSTNEILRSNHTTTTEIRSQTIIVLLSLKDKCWAPLLFQNLIVKLVDLDENVTNEKTRHFANSRIHRMQQRIWQCILLTEPLFDENLACTVIGVVFKKLVGESLQPSVRFLLEWLVVKILSDFPERITSFWDILEMDGSHHFGSLSSIFSIMFILGNVLERVHQVVFIEKALTVVLPWCMAQHYNTRMYAQVVFRKLWELCKTNCLVEVTEKFVIIESLLTKNTHSRLCGSGGAKQLYDDFKFRVFHPFEHFTFETIFYEVPRIFQVTQDEWIPANFFAKACGLCPVINIVIPLHNKGQSLSACEPRKWVDMAEDTTVVGEHKDVQRKLTPWKTMFPDLEALKESSNVKIKDSENSGLILVASLIDRAPNLGGLCRTCEIFGVSEYVVGSLAYTEDKQFQNLSVSAERWVCIKEVKPNQLKTYLLDMKKDGYTVVGAEQTANSTQLINYKFPKRTLLVLGNEKEGIPVDIIQLLDVSVEIPQQGVIRSLNVHVTGAIIIWEYTRQRIASNCATINSTPS